MDEVIVQFQKFRETKGTWRYEEIHDETEEPVLRNLYVRKSTIAKLGNPERLSVVIRPGFRA